MKKVFLLQVWGIRIRIHRTHIQKSRKVWWPPVNPALRRPGQVVPRTSSLDRLAGLGELQAQPEPAQYIRWREIGEEAGSQIPHTDTSEPPPPGLTHIQISTHAHTHAHTHTCARAHMNAFTPYTYTHANEKLHNEPGGHSTLCTMQPATWCNSVTEAPGVYGR